MTDIKIGGMTLQARRDGRVALHGDLVIEALDIIEAQQKKIEILEKLMRAFGSVASEDEVRQILYCYVQGVEAINALVEYKGATSGERE